MAKDFYGTSLQFFSKPVTIALTSGMVQSAADFADRVIQTVDYRDSYQGDRAKVRLDHFISKLGEAAVYQVLQPYANSITSPDYRIYHGSAKSWDADLRVNNIDLAVKTQSQKNADRFGLSWTFQAGRYRRDRILDQPDAWICFVLCGDHSPYNCRVFPPVQLRSLRLGEPKLERLRHEKKVVYANDNRHILGLEP
jgi:hypothetical protein